MRRCGRCREEKPLEDFAWRGKARGQLDNYCCPCRAAYKQEHYRAHRGETDPVVLEFDHLRDKKFTISKGIRDRNWQSVLDEIAKCEVVCANCHRRRTARRGGFARAVVAQR
jgi:hypothetical protein